MHDIAHAAADAARVPSFDDVLDRGHQIHRRRRALGVAGGALAVAGMLGIGQLIGFDGDGKDIQPAPPSPRPSQSQAVDGSGPAAYVDDEAALIHGAAVTDGGIGVLWTHPGGQSGPSGLAVSDDGFASRDVSRLPIPGEIEAAGDWFILRDQAATRLWVVDRAGERRPVAVSGPIAPVAAGEVPFGFGSQVVAIDPEAATAHPVPAPDLAYDVLAYGGRLSFDSSNVTGGPTTEVTYHWSDDGGASWASATFETAWDDVIQVVPTEAGADHVLAISTGRSIRPLGSVLTLPAAGGSFTETAYDGDLATFSGAFVVDGEIRFLGDLWGDSGPRESGLYRWTDGSLERVASGAEVTGREDATLVDVAPAPGGPVVLLADGAELFRSDDGGVSWTDLAAR